MFAHIQGLSESLYKGFGSVTQTSAKTMSQSQSLHHKEDKIRPVYSLGDKRRRQPHLGQ